MNLINKIVLFDQTILNPTAYLE